LPFKKKFDTTLILTYGTRGDDYRNWDADKIKLLDKLAKSISEYSGEKIVYIDLRNPQDVYIQLQSVKLRIGEINDTVFKRIHSISSILPQLKSFNKKIKYVDLRWEETKYLKLEYN
jgi:cell division septal protein FtsQ